MFALRSFNVELAGIADQVRVCVKAEQGAIWRGGCVR